MNHQAKEVKWLDDKEEEARVAPGGARSLFQSDSVLYTDSNKNWIITMILLNLIMEMFRYLHESTQDLTVL